MRTFDGVALYPLTLLYDGACPVCALEMDHLRARNADARLVFVDIATPGFDALPWGATLAQMNAQIHAVRPDGSLIVGIEALRLAYRAVGLGWLMAPTGWPPLRPAFDAGYRAFARHRQTLSRLAAPLIDGVRSQRARSMEARMRACAGGRCETPRPGASASRSGQADDTEGSSS